MTQAATLGCAGRDTTDPQAAPPKRTDTRWRSVDVHPPRCMVPEFHIWSIEELGRTM
jgi:hypothetical protein